MARVKTWKASPVIMRAFPVAGDLFECAAPDARPPPAAWRRSETRSHGMNYSLVSKVELYLDGDVQFEYKPQERS